MRRVFLLGAGASRAYTESPTGIRPPLASGLISAYNDLDISTNRYVLIGDIVNYVRDTRGVNPIKFGQWEEDIEAFFSEVSGRLGELCANPDADLDPGQRFQLISLSKIYDQLVFLFASIFNEIQNGPECSVYRLFAEGLRADDTVVTFNWDTLLDRAMESTKKWSISDGYGIHPQSVYSDAWLSDQSFKSKTSGPLLLKLHGSTNWLMPHQSINLSTRQRRSLSAQTEGKVFVFRMASQAYTTYGGRYWGPYQPFSYCYYPPNLPVPRDDGIPGWRRIQIVSAADLPEHGKTIIDDSSVYSMPIIIPPELNKRYDQYGQLFSKLWEKAQVAIAECQELFIIGYSFPGTDTRPRQLLANALSSSQSLERAVIINPDPERVAFVLRSELGLREALTEVRRATFEPREGSFDHLFERA